jgi:hypothetical protein
MIRLDMTMAATIALGAAVVAQSADTFDVRQDKDAMEGLCHVSAEDYIDTLRRGLDYVDTVLPNVPPEEAVYLAREREAVSRLSDIETKDKASHAPSNRRMDALSHRPMYYLWGARKDLADAVTSADGIYDPARVNQAFVDRKTKVNLWDPFRRPKVDTLYRMLSASQYLDSAVRSLQEFDSNGGYRLFGSEQEYQRFYGATLLLQFDLKMAMGCQLAHVVLDAPSTQASH